MKRLPSMIAPMLLVLAVLSTSAVKPVEYVRISPSRTVEVRENANRRQARCPRRTRPSAISALRRRVSAEGRLEVGLAVGLRLPVQLELPDEFRERSCALLAVLPGKDVNEGR
jgi:hypothetical protein